MPKLTDYELDHIEDEVTFEKVRKKTKQVSKDTKYPAKKKYREKKIEIGDLPEGDDEE